MDVSWLGGTCFRLQASGLQLVTDPFELPPHAPPQSGAVVTVSRRRPRAELALGAVERLLDGPGEYEIRGVLITGIATSLKRPPGEDRRNVVFSVVMDGVTVCHLGRLDQLPTGDPLQQIGAPDVVLIGIGEGEGLAPAQAAQLASQLEARILVPVPLGGAAGTGAVERFCRELGADPQNVLPRLTVSASGMPAQTQVVRLEPAIPPAPVGGADGGGVDGGGADA